MWWFAFTVNTGDINKTNDGGCYRSALQESALVVSLQMFNLLLEKFVKLLQDHIASPDPTALIVPPDCQAILPALKVNCIFFLVTGSLNKSNIFLGGSDFNKSLLN